MRENITTDGTCSFRQISMFFKREHFPITPFRTFSVLQVPLKHSHKTLSAVPPPLSFQTTGTWFTFLHVEKFGDVTWGTFAIPSFVRSRNFPLIVFVFPVRRCFRWKLFSPTRYITRYGPSIAFGCNLDKRCDSGVTIFTTLPGWNKTSMVLALWAIRGGALKFNFSIFCALWVLLHRTFTTRYPACLYFTWKYIKTSANAQNVGDFFGIGGSNPSFAPFSRFSAPLKALRPY